MAHFEIDPVTIYDDYSMLIDKGEPVFAFLPMDPLYMENKNLYAVLVVGYNRETGWLIYYNPTRWKYHECPQDGFVRDDVSYGLKERQFNN